MFEIVVKQFVDGNRVDDWVYKTRYVKNGNAKRKANELTREFIDHGRTYRNIAYVRKNLVCVTEDEAKEKYIHGYDVYVNSEYGKDKLRKSSEYGSHASREELFYRSASNFNYGNYYNGSYYIEA